MEPRDLRVYELYAEFARCRDAVVPVHHEVAAADLNHVDWRKISIGKGAQHRFQAFFQVGPQEPETPIKIAGAAHGPDDAVHLDGPQPAPALRRHPQPAPLIVKPEKRAAFCVSAPH